MRLLLATFLLFGGVSYAAPTTTPATPATTPATSTTTPGSLDAAYQKEFAYLLAERRALTERLSEVERVSHDAVSAGERGLASLQERLVSLQVQAEAAEDLLADVERSAESAATGDDLVRAAVFQATTTLQRDGFDLAQPAEPSLRASAKVLGLAYSEAMKRLVEGRTVRVQTGTYFLVDGTQVQGDVIKVGQIASYGVSPGGSLKPVGAGRLQLWRDGGVATAAALHSGKYDGPIGIFLYDNVDKGVEEAPEKTLMSVVEAGGPAGLVIIGLGLAALVLVVLRAVGLALLSGSGDRLVDRVANAVAQGRAAEALRLAQAGRGAVARVVSATVGRLELSHELLEDVVGEAMLREQPAADRFATAIVVIAAVAPLLGLLGTVTGMITTFDIITEFGTGDPRRLSGGISEALVTTQLGLVVAIPTLLVGNLLGAWSDGIMARVERSALRIMNVDAPDRSDRPSLSLAGPQPQANHAD